MIRTFYLDRPTDVTGVSGTGVVAHGVVFEDGTTVVRWLGEHRSTVVWPSWQDAAAIHGHHGTTFVWLDRYSPPGFDGIAAAAEIITTRWHLNAAEGKRAAPEEFAHEFALDLARAGVLVGALAPADNDQRLALVATVLRPHGWTVDDDACYCGEPMPRGEEAEIAMSLHLARVLSNEGLLR